jgi:hypothetical protein
MSERARMRVGVALLVSSIVAAAAGAQETTAAAKCKAIHAVMIEQRVTEGCKPEHDFCFIGEVRGNHGLRGTTYFRSDSSGSRPPTSPDFIPYSGPFEYHTRRGTLIMRETGVSNTSQGLPESGAVTAFQKIVSADGELAGATGYLFVSGFSRNGRVETSVMGEICFP